MSEMVSIELETIECYRREIDASRHLIIRLKSDLQAANNLLNDCGYVLIDGNWERIE
tara:strand:- start:550 stop:720 length:171 start_codon:yes stop_codon:yes gene_type:complete